MSEAPRFGTAGLSDSYRVRSCDPQAMAEYTASFGLTAFEYQCGRGVRLGLDKAAALKEAFDAKGITFSVHAPYYISMSSLEEDKRLNSIQYLLQSAAACRALGGKRIIFHSGSCGKQSREAALEKALDTMRRAVNIGDGIRFQCGLEHAVSAGVDDSSRPSGLPKDTRTLQYTGHSLPPQIHKNERI